MTWAVCEGDVPIMMALRSILGWENICVVEKLVLLEYDVGPLQRSKMEARG